MKKLKLAVLVAVSAMGFAFSVKGGALTAATEPMVELFPFEIVGRIVNADSVAYGGDSGISLYVTDSSGRRLAQTSVFSPGSLSAWNFVLQIPMASARATSYAMTGDAIELTATSGGAVYTGLLAVGDAKVGKPGSATRLKIMLAEDENGNGVADAYEESVLDRIWAMDLPLDYSKYDAKADYDRDGQCNIAEYLAGTDPLDASDYFAAKLTAIDGDLFALTLDMSAGRTYSVQGSEDLATWKRTAFRLSPEATGEVKYISNDSPTWKTATIYLLKNGDRHFYRPEISEGAGGEAK